MPKDLAAYIREVIAADERVDGPYTHNLADDDAVKQKSALVPDDIKGKIFGYFEKMKLTPADTKKKSKRRS